MKKIVIVGIVTVFLFVILAMFVNVNNKIKESEESRPSHVFDPGDYEFFFRS